MAGRTLFGDLIGQLETRELRMGTTYQGGFEQPPENSPYARFSQLWTVISEMDPWLRNQCPWNLTASILEETRKSFRKSPWRGWYLDTYPSKDIQIQDTDIEHCTMGLYIYIYIFQYNGGSFGTNVTHPTKATLLALEYFPHRSSLASTTLKPPVDLYHHYCKMTAPVVTSSSNHGVSAMEAVLRESLSRDGEQEGYQFMIAQVEHSSVPLARNMLHKIGLDETATAPFHLVDLGCGMGVVGPLLSETVPKSVLEKSKVLCADASEVLVDGVRRRIQKEGWIGMEARVVDAQVSGFSRARLQQRGTLDVQ